MGRREHQPCAICGRQLADWHHIMTRKSGGPDDAWNLIPLCRQHHVEIHSVGRITFLKKYFQFKDFLIKYGWSITDTKIFHEKG
jgi:hypothetical protein